MLALPDGRLLDLAARLAHAGHRDASPVPHAVPVPRAFRGLVLVPGDAVRGRGGDGLVLRGRTIGLGELTEPAVDVLLRAATLAKLLDALEAWASQPHLAQLDDSLDWSRLSPDFLADIWKGDGPPPCEPLSALATLHTQLAALTPFHHGVLAHASQWLGHVLGGRFAAPCLGVLPHASQPDAREMARLLTLPRGAEEH